MPSGTVTNLTELSKIVYPKGVAFLELRKSKLFMQARHKTDFTGKLREVKLTVGDGTGGSSDFAKALANRGPSKHVTFSVYRKKDYVVGSLENEAIKALKGDKGAVLDALKTELKLKGNEMGDRIRRRFWGSEGGSLGKVSAVSGSTMTLTNASDMRHHKEGKLIELASDNGTGSSPSGGRTGTLTTTKVDIASKLLTFSADVAATISGAAADDFLFHPGDYGTAPSGVLAWTPITKPTGSFLGVDRTKQPDLTSGFRFDGQGGDMIETLNDGCAVSFEYGTADERFCYMNGADFARLMNTMAGTSTNTRTVNGRDMFAAESWKGLVVYTPYGEVTCVAEPGVPKGYAVVTNPEDWCVLSLDELPHFSDTKFQQESAADAQQFRLIGYWNLLNEQPSNTTILTW
jgi:hypothetical protein